MRLILNTTILLGTILVSSLTYANTAPANNTVWHDVKTLPGVKYTALYGDPYKKGFFIARIKFPANYTVSPHFHPVNEYDTVISGALFYGSGKKVDLNKGKELTAGAYFFVPAKYVHYGWTKQETILQVVGTGPWSANYLKPESKTG